MRSPGLLGRSIAVSVIVAAVAIVATALLTLNVTQRSLERQQVQRTNVDKAVVDRLQTFGVAHPDWNGVATVLRHLAGRNQRLVLTDLHGQRLAATGGTTTTPASAVHGAHPSAVLNPLGLVLDATTSTVPSSYRDLGLPEILLSHRAAGGRLLLAAQHYPAVAVCYRRSADVSTSTANLPDPVVFVSVCSDAGSRARAPGAEPEQALALLNNAVVSDESTCLGRRGVRSLLVELNAASNGHHAPTLTSVSVPIDTASASPRTTARAKLAWHDCATASLTRRLSPVVAPEALLYIVRSRPVSASLVDRIGRIRIVTALGAILLAALAASILASRRVLLPVRRLTAATQQMARGQQPTRVEISGRDEVATLARSFNEMAGALAAGEEQRRRMVDDIAHELRTPLANIRGYLEAGHDGVLPRDAAWNASLLEEATLLQHVVDDLQTLAQADAGRLGVHPDATDVTGTVDLAIRAMSGYAASEGVRIERTGSDHAAPHDRMRMRQVVGNLLANAIRHAPDGSTVSVEIAATDADSVTVSVRDRGPGIEPEHLPHVFERFYRADASRTRHTGGSGLGLAIVEQLVAAHGGTVVADNAPGGGAVFRVTLPASP